MTSSVGITARSKSCCKPSSSPMPPRRPTRPPRRRMSCAARCSRLGVRAWCAPARSSRASRSSPSSGRRWSYSTSSSRRRSRVIATSSPACAAFHCSRSLPTRAWRARSTPALGLPRPLRRGRVHRGAREHRRRRRVHRHRAHPRRGRSAADPASELDMQPRRHHQRRIRDRAAEAGDQPRCAGHLRRRRAPRREGPGTQPHQRRRPPPCPRGAGSRATRSAGSHR